MTRLALLLTLLSTPALAADISGRARAVDGDTVRVGSQSVRLCGINSAETNTPEGRAARAAMRRLVDGRTLVCTPVGSGTVCDKRSPKTSHKRVVATCTLDGRDIAAEMVRQGMAKDWGKFSGGAYSAITLKRKMRND